ncbi:hypothetical protein KIH77_08130 [Bifidobacterium sp. 82T24]|uniref:hypothetical protein n=1 Tax=Bifidobacterium pluvialisilvae TaxID=2834436 RepID=UPI001C56E80C|nr:hypothetical protein [Bifidobacterium pluvialisilvae]MBW3088693.1 hypothetical protein [Bifidobacterium pluvialisilvae]
MNGDSTKRNDPGPVPMPGSGIGGSVDSGGSAGSGDKGVKSGKSKPGRKRVGIIIAIIVAVIVIVGAIIGWRIVDSRSQASALDDCKTQVNALASAQETTKSKLDKAKETAKTDAKSLADAKTLTTLQTAISDVDVTSALPQCGDDTSAKDLRSAADSAKTSLDKLNTSTTALDKAVKAVSASKDAKTLSDAKAALQKQIAIAEKLLKSSDGKVKDDDRSRGILEDQIADAKKVLSSSTSADSSALSSLKSKTQGIQTSIDAVNTSVREKAAADKKAQEAAADKSRCSAIVGIYAPANSGGGPVIDAGCNIGSGEGGWPASQYVAGSYQDLGSGRFSWRTSDGSKLTYYPAGSYAPLQATMTPEFLAPAGITDPTNTPKIQMEDNPNSMGGIGTLMFKG